MNLQDWIECGYTKEEAKSLVKEHGNEDNNIAHRAFANSNLR